jgi:DNA-binding NarL/FixJ family response regulator
VKGRATRGELLDVLSLIACSTMVVFDACASAILASWQAPEPAPTPSQELTLTPAEHEVLWHVAAGAFDAEIAQARGCTTSTVQSHLHSVQRKLGARHRIEAVLIALEMGLIAAPSLRSKGI